MTPKRRGRALCFALIAFFYLMSVPWYRDTDAPLRIWFGLPDWVFVALFCYVGVAVANSVAWLLCEVEDPPQSEGGPPEEGQQEPDAGSEGRP